MYSNISSIIENLKATLLIKLCEKYEFFISISFVFRQLLSVRTMLDRTNETTNEWNEREIQKLQLSVYFFKNTKQNINSKVLK